MTVMAKSTRKTPKNTAEGLYPNRPGFKPAQAVAVGGTLLAEGDIEYNTGRRTVTVEVRNSGDRPVQVGSHFHFFEVNRALLFDRAAAFGMHLNIPATTAVRFEAGDSKRVELVAFGGKRRIVGFNALTEGYAGDEASPAYLPSRTLALQRAATLGFYTPER